MTRPDQTTSPEEQAEIRPPVNPEEQAEMQERLEVEKADFTATLEHVEYQLAEVLEMLEGQPAGRLKALIRKAQAEAERLMQ